MRRLLPITLFLVALAAIARLDSSLPVVRVVGWPWRLAALVPMIISGAMIALAARALREARTTVKPFKRPTSLVTHGVYRISRNPMYLAMILILAGAALFAGSISPWAVVLIFAILMDRLVVVPEEATLEQAFGDEFLRYRRKVRRWI